MISGRRYKIAKRSRISLIAVDNSCSIISVFFFGWIIFCPVFRRQWERGRKLIRVEGMGNGAGEPVDVITINGRDIDTDL